MIPIGVRSLVIFLGHHKKKKLHHSPKNNGAVEIHRDTRLKTRTVGGKSGHLVIPSKRIVVSEHLMDDCFLQQHPAHVVELPLHPEEHLLSQRNICAQD